MCCVAICVSTILLSCNIYLPALPVGWMEGERRGHRKVGEIERERRSVKGRWKAAVGGDGEKDNKMIL